VTVHQWIENSAFGQHVSRVKMLAWFKDARHATLNADLHLATQYENPLRGTGAMKSAAKSNGTPAQLKTS
jgi:acyl-CoA thioesterase FadM